MHKPGLFMMHLSLRPFVACCDWLAANWQLHGSIVTICDRPAQLNCRAELLRCIHPATASFYLSTTLAAQFACNSPYKLLLFAPVVICYDHQLPQIQWLTNLPPTRKNSSLQGITDTSQLRSTWTHLLSDPNPNLLSLSLFPYLHIQYDEGLHGYMDSGSAAAAMYDPHAGHRPPGLQGLPPHHSPHMSHAAAAAAAGAVGMHGYHSGHGSAPSHVSPVANHVMGSIPEVHKRDKDAIYGYVPTTTRRWW